MIIADIFFVSLGATLGANTRFRISKKSERVNLSKHFSILIINTFSSFCLGLFLCFLEKSSSFIYSYQLALFFAIGFLGSLSTFSTFIYDLFDLACLQFKFSRAFNLFIISSSLGILAFAFGFLVGNQ
jgi:CrcB protein